MWETHDFLFELRLANTMTVHCITGSMWDLCALALHILLACDLFPNFKCIEFGNKTLQRMCSTVSPGEMINHSNVAHFPKKTNTHLTTPLFSCINHKYTHCTIFTIQITVRFELVDTSCHRQCVKYTCILPRLCIKSLAFPNLRWYHKPCHTSCGLFTRALSSHDCNSFLEMWIHNSSRVCMSCTL